MVIACLVITVAGAVFGVWSHLTTGSNGWTDAFLSDPKDRMDS